MPAIIRFVFVALAIARVSPVAASVSDQLAIVVNSTDPQSWLVAAYYQKQRAIPDENIIVVDFPARAVLDKNKFQQIYRQVREKTPEHIQFYALAWSKPYRVGCMSVTSAFTFGYDEKYCADSCKPTAASAYFNSKSRRPFDDFKLRPSMMLAGSSTEQVFATIDRGVRSDHTHPDGMAYLVSTSDVARNVRAKQYSSIIDILGDRSRFQIVETDALKNKNDVMFYFTGRVRVPDITTNIFIDGAIADHLTSTGGVLFDGRQMSILRWLDAGATASYGTVVEPCAITQKFPHPGIVLDWYTRGQTLIESYWKSVAWPGQGVFVGEPLAAPFSKISVNHVELK